MQRRALLRFLVELAGVPVRRDEPFSVHRGLVRLTAGAGSFDAPLSAPARLHDRERTDADEHARLRPGDRPFLSCGHATSQRARPARACWANCSAGTARRRTLRPHARRAGRPPVQRASTRSRSLLPAAVVARCGGVPRLHRASRSPSAATAVRAGRCQTRSCAHQLGNPGPSDYVADLPTHAMPDGRQQQLSPPLSYVGDRARDGGRCRPGGLALC